MVNPPLSYVHTLQRSLHHHFMVSSVNCIANNKPVATGLPLKLGLDDLKWKCLV